MQPPRHGSPHSFTTARKACLELKADGGWDALVAQIDIVVPAR
jgi:hypothetical protein